MGGVRHAIRSLAKARAFTLIAMVSLAVGIGANAAIFNLLNAVVLRQLATVEPERLVGLTTVDAKGRTSGFSYSTFEQLRAHTRTLSGMFAWQDLSVFTLEAEGSLFPGGALLAGEGFSATMPIRPVIGREHRTGRWRGRGTGLRLLAALFSQSPGRARQDHSH